MEAEEELKNHWFAVAFVSKLGAVSAPAWPHLISCLHAAVKQQLSAAEQACLHRFS
jgi:hypothetical protein